MYLTHPTKKQTVDLESTLALMVGSKINLKLHANRSTMVSIRAQMSALDVKIHQHFTQAPVPVLKSLAAYIKGNRGSETIPLKRFIHEEICRIDLTSHVKQIVVKPQGKVWDLQTIYHKIENKYFKNPLNLSVTWFGNRTRRTAPKRCTLGLYYDMLRMVKVHRLLDQPFVPLYVVEYILYHEMVHSICPTEVDSSGRAIIHTPRFYELEKRYPLQIQAETWLHNNINLLFKR